MGCGGSADGDAVKSLVLRTPAAVPCSIEARCHDAILGSSRCGLLPTMDHGCPGLTMDPAVLPPRPPQTFRRGLGCTLPPSFASFTPSFPPPTFFCLIKRARCDTDTHWHHDWYQICGCHSPSAALCELSSGQISGSSSEPTTSSGTSIAMDLEAVPLHGD